MRRSYLRAEKIREVCLKAKMRYSGDSRLILNWTSKVSIHTQQEVLTHKSPQKENASSDIQRPVSLRGSDEVFPCLAERVP